MLELLFFPYEGKTIHSQVILKCSTIKGASLRVTLLPVFRPRLAAPFPDFFRGPSSGTDIVKFLRGSKGEKSLSRYISATP